MEVVDVDGIHSAREFIRLSLAKTLNELFLKTYNAHKTNESYRYDPVLAGGRRLKNLCLSYLSVLDDDKEFSFVYTILDLFSFLDKEYHSYQESDEEHSRKYARNFVKSLISKCKNRIIL